MPDSTHIPAPSFIPLGGAFLCEDCHHIGNNPEQCSQCASANIALVQPMIEARASIPSCMAHLCCRCDRIVANGAECTNCRSHFLMPLVPCLEKIKAHWAKISEILTPNIKRGIVVAHNQRRWK